MTTTFTVSPKDSHREFVAEVSVGGERYAVAALLSDDHRTNESILARIVMSVRRFVDLRETNQQTA